MVKKKKKVKKSHWMAGLYPNKNKLGLKQKQTNVYIFFLITQLQFLLI